MNIAFHTGKTAMIAQAQALNVYGNNIANINTYGYQTVRPSFADCLYSTQRATEADWQTGHGAYIQRTGVMFDESSFYYTERPLDFALPNEGFFAVEDRYGDINYTRDGAFAMTQADTGEWYLVSGSGEYVLDYDNNRIVVPFSEDGTAPDYDTLRDMVGVFRFDNVYGIDAAADNRYAATERSGPATAERTFDKLQGALADSSEPAVSNPIPTQPNLTRKHYLQGAGIGLVAGLASGYVGVGGGFIMVPMMLAILSIPMSLAAGTSLIAIMILAIPGVIEQAILGNINYFAGISIVVGTIPGAVIGARDS